MVNRSKIKVEKIADNVFVASCDVYSPLIVHLTMKGKSENIAREKLVLFLENKKYKHLDK